ncbi:MAG TPA: hypothetical protein VKA95_08515 [Nitrososphaeraceae archaeon]|nr:hypothetical protein [Nitrososphaeraceae archaeon]
MTSIDKDDISTEALATIKTTISNQVIGNIGLYYICYELCRRGCNVMPTSRNARGVDIVIYSQDGVRKHTIQVKSLSRRSPVPFGSNLDSLFPDYLIICRNILNYGF